MKVNLNKTSTFKMLLCIFVLVGAGCQKKQAEDSVTTQNHTLRLQIVYSPEIEQYVNSIKAGFALSGPELSDHTKIDLDFIKEPGMLASKKLARGDLKTEAWIAPSTSLVNYTNSHLQNLGARHSNCSQLFSTPVVIAVGRENADSFPSQKQKVSWHTLAATKLNLENKVNSPQSIVFSHSSPQGATGFASYLQLAYLATTATGDSLSLEALKSESSIETLRSYEGVVSSYSKEDLGLLERTAAAGTKRIRFTVTTEQQVAIFNQTHSEQNVPLIALYPEEGSVWQDYSFCVAEADWVNPAKRAALKILSNYLGNEKAQEPARKLGFRPARSGQSDTPPLTSDFGVNTLLPEKSLRPVSGDVVSYLLESWPNFMRPSATVLVLDTSGSMEGPPLSMAQESIRNFVARLADQDKVALLSFSSQPKLLAAFGTDAPTIMAKVDEATSQGGSAIYDSLQQAIDLLTVPELGTLRKNIVIISDGGDINSELSLQGTINYINEKLLRYDINLFVVGLNSSNPDELQDLRKICKVANGLYQQGPPSALPSMFDTVISGF